MLELTISSTWALWFLWKCARPIQHIIDAYRDPSKVDGSPGEYFAGRSDPFKAVAPSLRMHAVHRAWEEVLLRGLRVHVGGAVSSTSIVPAVDGEAMGEAVGSGGLPSKARGKSKSKGKSRGKGFAAAHP